VFKGRHPASLCVSDNMTVSASPYAFGVKTVVLGDPPQILGSLIFERQRLGLDTYDELWVGVQTQ
jgi:hypothetical protein